MSDRDFDLVLLGATGFTGRLAAEHLSRRLSSTTTRWAIAGRSEDKLHALRDDLPGATPDVVVVDVEDADGLRALAGRTDVLATTVGPFARFGEPVVEACVAAGTDYCDITGEPGFVANLLERFDDRAREAGVRIVTCCGFDSVPHDLGARYTAVQLPQDGPITVRGYVHARGRASGGTLESAIGAIASRRTAKVGRPREGEDPQRAVRGLSPRPHKVPELGAYAAPLPTIDPAIVLRSARVLDGYGTTFSYGHYAQVGSLPVLAAGLAGVGTFATLAAIPPTRRVLRRFLPKPGEGPSEDQRARSRFQVTFIGEGGGQRVITRVRGGDPGYDETAKMLGEAALSLAQDGRGDHAGVLTPAVALGDHYQARLEQQGLVFEVLDEQVAAGHEAG